MAGYGNGACDADDEHADNNVDPCTTEGLISESNASRKSRLVEPVACEVRGVRVCAHALRWSRECVHIACVYLHVCVRVHICAHLGICIYTDAQLYNSSMC